LPRNNKRLWKPSPTLANWKPWPSACCMSIRGASC
jgi:hypothetical protein